MIGGARMDSTNPFFKSKYADLESVFNAIKEPFAANGLSVCQIVNVGTITTMLLHSSGQWISGESPIKTKDDSAQAMGSGITYARRYALSSICGVYSSEDDDGNLAQAPRNEYNQVKFPPKLEKPLVPIQKTVLVPREENSTKPRQAAPLLNHAEPFPSDHVDNELMEDLGKTKFPFGKYSNKTICEIGLVDLKIWLVQINKAIATRGKPAQGVEAEMIETVTKYLQGYKIQLNT